MEAQAGSGLPRCVLALCDTGCVLAPVHAAAFSALALLDEVYTGVRVILPCIRVLIGGL